VYSTVEDANRRNDYLGEVDGTIFASGSHIVFGTLIIRTSNNLKASQQIELTDQIKEVLVELR
jgi:hypothetical protein